MDFSRGEERDVLSNLASALPCHYDSKNYRVFDQNLSERFRMTLLNRRQAFKAFLGGLVQTAGTVVLASSVLPASAAQSDNRIEGKEKSLEERANELAESQATLPEGEFCAFVNGGFRNASFRNGGFTNGGGFKNGSFSNGGFKNGGFANGSFKNGGFSNGSFGNGSFGKY